MGPQDLFSYFQKQQDTFVDLLTNLVSYQTFTGERANINFFVDFLQRLFFEFNPEIERVQTTMGDIVQFTLFPDKKDLLILLAHMDTIKATEAPLTIRIEKDHLYGNGSYDMKNGIALFYFSIKAFKELKMKVNKKIKLIFTPDEENGSKESMPFLLKECQGAKAVLLAEPCCSNGGIKTKRKGIALLSAKLQGKAAHSGIEPEKGKDANRGLIQLANLIEKILGSYSDISFNPGIIQGGSNTNVVSSQSILKGEIRSYSSQDLSSACEELKKIKNVNGIKVKLDMDIIQPPLEFNSQNQKLYQYALDIARKMKHELPCCSSGGGSDASNLSQAGIPVLDGLGMNGGGAHSPDEYIKISDFPFRATLFSRLCQEIV